VSRDHLQTAISDSMYLANENDYFTFNSEDPYIKIDFIIYDSRKIGVANARVVKEAGLISDHLPVLADIILLEQTSL